MVILMAKAKKKKSFTKKDAAEIIGAFIVAWLFYQGLVFATGTSLPIVSVVSDSMEPVLHRGDLLFVVSPAGIDVGDIAIYKRDASDFTIVHRVIAIDGDIFTIKGDNNQRADPPVRRDQIIGKVVAGAPLLGYPRLVLNLVGI